MQELDFIDDDGTDTVFRDVIMLALAGFVAMVILLLPHLNPPAKAKENVTSPGNVIVEIRWADEVDADVDLWVMAPGDTPVGYSNKGGMIFNLLRDDLGRQADVTNLNYEVSYSRGVPTGEYAVNVHMYRNNEAHFPLRVSIVVSVKRNPKEAARQILSTNVTLRHDGEEVTAFRFTLDSDGQLVPGSVHDIPKALRSARS